MQAGRPSILAVERTIEAADPSPIQAPHNPSLVSRSVAIVIPESKANLFSDPYFLTLLQGIYSGLADRGILAVMVMPNSPGDTKLIERYLTGKYVDGAIVVGPRRDNPLAKYLREHDVPTVIQGRPHRGVAASCVDSDNRQGGALAVNHLIAQGRRRIATIAGNLDLTSGVDRLMGYRDALAAAGIAPDPTLEEIADFQPDRAQMSMERLLLNHPDVDAVFAASDRMAVAAIAVLVQARKRVPEDVAVVGFDDSPTAGTTRPRLSSIRQPIEEMGRETVNVLMREIAEPDKAPRHVIFPTELVVRESTVGTSGIGAVGQLI
jgi:DNA-binding LacI/PurR family transcriptional regulator